MIYSRLSFERSLCSRCFSSWSISLSTGFLQQLAATEIFALTILLLMKSSAQSPCKLHVFPRKVLECICDGELNIIAQCFEVFLAAYDFGLFRWPQSIGE